MKHSEYSAVIVGSGVAGLYVALKLSQQMSLPDGILLITKDELGECNSKYAQGGIVGVIHQNPIDSVESHVADTLKAGAGLSDEKVTEYILEGRDFSYFNESLRDLIGVRFVINPPAEIQAQGQQAESDFLYKVY